MKKLLQFPDTGRQLTKQSFRAEFAEEWRQFASREAEGAWEILNNPKTIGALEAYMARLKTKSSSKL